MKTLHEQIIEKYEIVDSLKNDLIELLSDVLQYLKNKQYNKIIGMDVKSEYIAKKIQDNQSELTSLKSQLESQKEVTGLTCAICGKPALERNLCYEHLVCNVPKPPSNSQKEVSDADIEKWGRRRIRESNGYFDYQLSALMEGAKAMRDGKIANEIKKGE